MSIKSWMSWEGGVDLVALSNENAPVPNIIVHFARMVHTPIGSAPAGMLLLPDETGAPKVMGFVSTDKAVGDYFGANVFAGTPFESAPTLIGELEIETNFPLTARATISVDGYQAVLKLNEFDVLSRVARQSPNLPFHEDVLEAKANAVSLTVNGEETSIIIPPMGISGGPAAVYSATGIYSR